MDAVLLHQTLHPLLAHAYAAFAQLAPNARPAVSAARLGMHRANVHQQRRPAKGELLFHSDRGTQYASEDFARLLDEHGITASMSRKGNCWDNACSETLFGSLKVEWLHGQRFATIREAKDAVLEWLRWYNRNRMHSTPDYVSPAEYEQLWMQQQNKAAA
jgi:putative transposase